MKRFGLILLTTLLAVGCNKPHSEATADEHGHDEATHAEATKQGEAEKSEEHVEGQVKLTPEAEKLAGIKLYVASTRQVQDALEVPGSVTSTSRGRAVLTPPIAGRVTSIAVQLGDSVKQGQTLAYLESPELALSWSTVAEATKLRDTAISELKQVKAEVDIAEAKVKSAKNVLNRQKEFVKAGAFSQAPLQQAKNDLNDAQSELLSIQTEQASHAEQFRRFESLFREGIVSKSDFESSKLELQQDQIRLDRVKAKIENAKTTYEREKNIASRGLQNSKELQVAEADVRSSQLELERSKIRVRSAESAVASANRSITNAQSVYKSNRGNGLGAVGKVALVAPISGVVSHLDMTRGQAVDRTQVLLEIENLQSVWVTANVAEQDFTKINRGASVRITTPALPNQEFEGIVEVIGSKVDPKTRSIPVQCLVMRAAGRLKPDMFAKVALQIGNSTNSIVIPFSSVVRMEKQAFVFVKEGEAYEKREVKLGSRTGEFIVVASGIKVGEQVVSQGSFVLNSEQMKDELKGHDH